MKVMLDPGHAGRNVDPGAVNKTTGLQEADINLLVAERIYDYLAAVGHEVKMTRTDWQDAASDDMSYRTDMASAWGADVFVSIHCNASDNSDASGYEVWTSRGQTNGDILATCIFDQIESTFPDAAGRIDYSDGDADKESNFYVLVYTDAPACLVEIGFISNRAEAALMASSVWRDRYAAAIARGITDYFAEVR